MALVMSSVMHLAVVHAWTLRARELNRGQGKLAILLGFVLFIAIFGLVRLLRRMFYREEVRDHT